MKDSIVVAAILLFALANAAGPAKALANDPGGEDQRDLKRALVSRYRNSAGMNVFVRRA